MEWISLLVKKKKKSLTISHYLKSVLSLIFKSLHKLFSTNHHHTTSVQVEAQDSAIFIPGLAFFFPVPQTEVLSQLISHVPA